MLRLGSNQGGVISSLSPHIVVVIVIVIGRPEWSFPRQFVISQLLCPRFPHSFSVPIGAQLILCPCVGFQLFG